MDRKLDTRHKIELGGLVIKAKLGEYPKSAILGILIEAADEILANNKILGHYQAIGDLAFAEKIK